MKKRLFANIIIYTLIILYFIWDKVFVNISNFVFKYTPFKIFSDKIHDMLINKNRYIVLFVFLFHFVIMQLFAVLSGNSFLSGYFVMGIVYYIFKGLLAIPTFRFFKVEKERLTSFFLIKIIYNLLLWIESTTPYQKTSLLIKKVKSFVSLKYSNVINNIKSVIFKK